MSNFESASLIVSDDDVVVTGWGAITPLGHDLESHIQALLRGTSATKLLHPESGVDGYRWVGACIEGFDPKVHVQPRKAIKVMCREIQLAFGSAMQACKRANIEAGTVDPDRIGTVFSGEIILSDILDVEDIVRRCSSDGEMRHSEWSTQAMENMYPLWMLKALPNMAACHVGIALDARGPNNTITTEGTSSLGAMLEAVNVIRRNKADVMVVGSTASRVNPSRLLQRHEEDFTADWTDPATACRPFDNHRSGTVPGEVSSAIVLERRGHAIRRGAKPLALIRAWSSVFSPNTAGRWSGTEQATRRTLQNLCQRAGLSAAEIDHINASANGTRAGDSAEAKGIEKVFTHKPTVSYKGALGDSISASGLIEWLSSAVGMQLGQIPPTVNHVSRSLDCPIDVISNGPKARESSSFIKLSQTPAGRCIGVLTQVES